MPAGFFKDNILLNNLYLKLTLFEMIIHGKIHIKLNIINFKKKVLKM